MSTSKPTIPCAPGGSPVPNVAVEVAVVDGNPHDSRYAAPSPERRNGACPPRRRSSSSPSPSTRTTTARRAGVSGSSGRPAYRWEPSEATTEGSTEARVPTA